MIVKLIDRTRSPLNGIFRTRLVNDDLQDEFRLHMELRAADLVRAGMTQADAARKARAEFGGTDDHVEKARHARGLAWFDAVRFSWLDVKVGGRMLFKYPMLTLRSGATGREVRASSG